MQIISMRDGPTGCSLKFSTGMTKVRQLRVSPLFPHPEAYSYVSRDVIINQEQCQQWLVPPPSCIVTGTTLKRRLGISLNAFYRLKFGMTRS